ncbi:MAG: phosphopentomutase [Gammaproteobacteria bacterium]|nr:phosphopentomutase [Gammaproteobacteria bacterium]
MVKRVVVLLLDSFGIGASQDADKYGDKGANTLGHILDYCKLSTSAQKRKSHGPLRIPHLSQLGLLAALSESIGGPPDTSLYNARYGYGVELSYGKDTPSGHWEICGVPVLFDWGYFDATYPSFPQSLTDAFIEETGVIGILGNRHASGTQIIDEFGQEHIRSDKPIVYTSGDSVFQIAAHEESFGLDRLYHLCEVARRLVDPFNIGRVIARPFSGEPGHFYRTGNRRDYSLPPPAPTLLDKLKSAGGEVIAIGKTADIFAHQGITQEIKAVGNMKIFDATLDALTSAPDRSLIFANFVDFDSSYGHRRDVEGYAAALEEFDQRLPEINGLLTSEDIVVITADHGCDPTWPGSDHTREHIPILVYGPGVKSPGSIGKRITFADIGQSLASHLNLPALKYGTPFLGELP